jgi:hypothetical protein
MERLHFELLQQEISSLKAKELSLGNYNDELIAHFDHLSSKCIRKIEALLID